MQKAARSTSAQSRVSSPSRRTSGIARPCSSRWRSAAACGAPPCPPSPVPPTVRLPTARAGHPAWKPIVNGFERPHCLQGPHGRGLQSGASRSRPPGACRRAGEPGARSGCVPQPHKRPHRPWQCQRQPPRSRRKAAGTLAAARPNLICFGADWPAGAAVGHPVPRAGRQVQRPGCRPAACSPGALTSWRTAHPLAPLLPAVPPLPRP